MDWSLLERRRRQRGGGGSGGGTGAWQQSVENRLAQLHADIMDVRGEVRALRGEMGGWFRWLIGLLVISFAAILGVMGRGFDWL